MATEGQAAPTAAQPDPVAAIQSILDAETAPEQKAPTEGDPQPEAQEAPPEENRQVEGEEAQADAPAEIPLDQLEAVELEVTVKGEDGRDVVEKPTVKELREGYMRQKDYSRKTAEVARQREEVGEKVRQAVESERSQYLKNLQEMQTLVLETAAPELKDVNWNDLAKNDPFKYVELRNRADQITNVLSNLQAKQTEVSTKQQADQKEATTKAASKALEVLQAEIPGWGVPLYQSLLKAGERLGYKHEEVSAWTDPRAIKLLHKAELYDQLKAGKPQPGAKVSTPPKVIKPGASTVSQSQQRNSEAMKRLQDSGRVEDAAAVIRARMG